MTLPDVPVSATSFAAAVIEEAAAAAITAHGSGTFCYGTKEQLTLLDGQPTPQVQLLDLKGSPTSPDQNVQRLAVSIAFLDTEPGEGDIPEVSMATVLGMQALADLFVQALDRRMDVTISNVLPDVQHQTQQGRLTGVSRAFTLAVPAAPACALPTPSLPPLPGPKTYATSDELDAVAARVTLLEEGGGGGTPPDLSGYATTAALAAEATARTDGDEVNATAAAAAQATADSKEDAGTAAGLLTAHEAAADPHPQYLTNARGDARYDAVGAAAAGDAALRDGVTSAGDTLQKLYNMIVVRSRQYSVDTIAERNALDVRIRDQVFVSNDGDGNWALYWAVTAGVGATFQKISDPDLLNAVMTAAQIKAAYESNPDTNAFTNALLAKLNAAVTTVNGQSATGGAVTIDDATINANDPSTGGTVRTVRQVFTNIWAAITGKQPLSTVLTAFSGLTGTAGKVPYFTGATTMDVFDTTSFGRGIVNHADKAAFCFALGLPYVFANETYDPSPLTVSGTAAEALFMTYALPVGLLDAGRILQIEPLYGFSVASANLKTAIVRVTNSATFTAGIQARAVPSTSTAAGVEMNAKLRFYATTAFRTANQTSASDGTAGALLNVTGLNTAAIMYVHINGLLSAAANTAGESLTLRGVKITIWPAV